VNALRDAVKDGIVGAAGGFAIGAGTIPLNPLLGAALTPLAAVFGGAAGFGGSLVGSAFANRKYIADKGWRVMRDRGLGKRVSKKTWKKVSLWRKCRGLAQDSRDLCENQEPAAAGEPTDGDYLEGQDCVKEDPNAAAVEKKEQEQWWGQGNGACERLFKKAQHSDGTLIKNGGLEGK